MAVAFRVQYGSPSANIQGERVVTQLPIRFGRNALNHTQIVHSYISDFHAVVELLNNTLCVRDLNSKNGVFRPSGQRIAPNAPTPIDTAGECSFVLGGLVRVKVAPFAQDMELGRRASEARGSVLGNCMMMQSGALRPSDPPLSGALRPSDPPLPRTPMPQQMGSSFVAPPAVLDPSAGQPAGGAPYLAALPSVQASSVQAPGPGYPPNAPSQAPRFSPGTQQLSLSMETMAALGLQELASSLVPGVPLKTTGDVARLLTKLHDALEMFCRCFVPMREGYAQFMSSMDLQRAASQRSLNRSPTALRIEQARDPASVAAALLDWRNQDYDAPQVVEGIFADLMMHQLALVDGIMRGVHALLDELSPERIEHLQNEQGPGGVSAMLGRQRALWQTYVAHHEELRNETRLFEVVFGADFAESYREYLARRGATTR
jgi:type VI secretion system protein ImpI